MMVGMVGNGGGDGARAETIVSVNVGAVTDVPYRGGRVPTGIFKGPAGGRVAVGPVGLEGDTQADLSVHGGPDKAVYLYSADDYAWWAEELGHALAHGEFGENLTVTGLGGHAVRVGDRIRAGEVLLEVTTPREPCFKLGIRMGDPAFVVRFRDAGRTGFYARVVETGMVAEGDAAEIVERAPASAPTIGDVHRAFTTGRDDPGLLRRLAGTPALPDDWRAWMLRRAEEAEARA
jgi:MOSC domain-containing protein YiiM